MDHKAPLKVDELFVDIPGLFAYELRSTADRELLAVGEEVKLFFNVDGSWHPRAMWLVVTGKSETGFKGALTSRYTQELRAEFGEVHFDVSHIYRLYVKGRVEVENRVFDDSLRDLAA